MIFRKNSIYTMEYVDCKLSQFNDQIWNKNTEFESTESWNTLGF